MTKALVQFLCAFVPSAVLRHKIRDRFLSNTRQIYWSFKPYFNSGKNNKVVVIFENGKRKTLSKYQRIQGINIHLGGDNNLVEIEFPCKLWSSSIRFEHEGQHSRAFIGKNASGQLGISLYGDNNIFTLGENADMVQMSIAIINNELHIGKDCMISAGVIIFGDGHSVLDYATKKVINLPKAPILIGDHCWLGMQTTFLKGAQIPNDCIVGFKSLVTKPFTTEHCVIAGNPAKIVKEGISWDKPAPVIYKRDIEDKK